MFDVPERFTEEPVDFKIVMPGGTLKEVPMYRHYNRKMAHISESFDKMLDGYELTGAARKVCFGEAECILCDAVEMYEVTKQILKKEINCFIDKDKIPTAWYLNN